MKFPISLTIITLCLLSSAKGDAELDSLKASYEAAIKRATLPIRQKFEDSLAELLKRRTQAGDLQGALAVQKEIDALEASREGAGATASGSEKDASESPEDNLRLFVGKDWKTPTGTNFTFKKDGTGTRQFGSDKTSFVWRQLEGGMIEATGPSNQGGSNRTWFFKFVSRNEAYYGNNKEDLGMKLVPQ